MHNTPQENEDFRRAWDATNARWRAQQKAHEKQQNNKMTNAQICELYDSKPNLTLRELSQITGLSIAALKLILMEKNNG